MVSDLLLLLYAFPGYCLLRHLAGGIIIPKLVCFVPSSALWLQVYHDHSWCRNWRQASGPAAHQNYGAVSGAYSYQYSSIYKLLMSYQSGSWRGMVKVLCQRSRGVGLDSCSASHWANFVLTLSLATQKRWGPGVQIQGWMQVQLHFTLIEPCWGWGEGKVKVKSGECCMNIWTLNRYLKKLTSLKKICIGAYYHG